MASLIREDESFQGQLTIREGERVELDIKGHFEIPWTRPVSLRFLQPIKKGRLDDQVEQVFRDHLSDEAFETVTEGYVHSSKITDPELKTKALTQLIREPQEVDDDDLVMDLLMAMATTEPSNGIYYDRPTAADYMDIPTKNSSSGAINLDPFNGVVGGKKYDLQASAALAAEAGTPMLNGEPHPKPEVLKTGKKVRQIICQAYPIYLKAAYYFEHVVNRRANLAGGRAMGMVFKGGGFFEIHRRFYLDHLEFFPETTWEEFQGILEEEGLEEGDIKAFEANINDETCIVYTIMQAASFSHLAVACQADVAQVLADYFAMPVKYDGHKCYFAFGTVGSGSYTTEHGNSWRHLYGVQSASHKVQLHDDECPGCEVCPYADMTMYELSKLVGGVVLGDDRKQRAGRDFGALMKLVMGCEFVSVIKPPYTDGTSDSAEFLRKKVTKDGRLSREPIRVLAKLFHGEAKRDPRTLGAAVTSASLEFGAEDGYRHLLQALLDLVDKDDRTLTDKERDMFGISDEHAVVHNAHEAEIFYQPSDLNFITTLRDHAVLMC